MKYFLTFFFGILLSLVLCTYLLFGVISAHPSKIALSGKTRTDVIQMLSERCREKWDTEKDVFVIRYSALPTIYHTPEEALNDTRLFNADLWIVNKVGGRFPYVSNWQIIGFDKNTSDGGNKVSTTSTGFGFFFK